MIVRITLQYSRKILQMDYSLNSGNFCKLLIGHRLFKENITIIAQVSFGIDKRFWQTQLESFDLPDFINDGDEIIFVVSPAVGHLNFLQVFGQEVVAGLLQAGPVVDERPVEILCRVLDVQPLDHQLVALRHQADHFVLVRGRQLLKMFEFYL